VFLRKSRLFFMVLPLKELADPTVRERIHGRWIEEKIHGRAIDIKSPPLYRH